MLKPLNNRSTIYTGLERRSTFSILLSWLPLATSPAINFGNYVLKNALIII